MRNLVTFVVLGMGFLLLLRPQAVVESEAAGDCLPLAELHAEHPDASAEEIWEAEQCLKEQALAAGRSGPSTRFLGTRTSAVTATASA